MLLLDVDVGNSALAADLLESILHVTATLDLVKLDHLEVDTRLLQGRLGALAVRAV